MMYHPGGFLPLPSTVESAGSEALEGNYERTTGVLELDQEVADHCLNASKVQNDQLSTGVSTARYKTFRRRNVEKLQDFGGSTDLEPQIGRPV